MTTALAVGVSSADVGVDEFTSAVRKRMKELGIGQPLLGSMVAEEMAREQPYSQSAVSQWLRGENAIEWQIVFAIERVLGVPPGEFSKLLGFVPVSKEREPRSTEAAIRRDPHLSDAARRALLAAYREMIR